MAARVWLVLALCAAACVFKGINGQSPEMLSCIGMEAIQGMMVKCAREVYMKFRVDSTLDCGSTIRSSMPKCLNDTAMQCIMDKGLTSQLPPNATSGLGDMFKDPTSVMPYCSTIAPQLVQPFYTNCSTSFFMKMVPCTAETTAKFQSNKGDEGLCGSYTKMVQCLLDAAKTDCNADDVQQFTTNYPDAASAKYSPFCSAAQGGAAQGGGNGVSGASTLSGMASMMLVLPVALFAARCW